MSYQEQYHSYYEAVENALEDALPVCECHQRKVEDAMRYSLLGAGKRLRGVLVLAFCEQFGGNYGSALPLACAIEMVHAYSLIHDDLPCMDDDNLRRGKPTCHIQYGEAVALLAGDALLTKAFELISEGADGLSVQNRLAAVALLAKAAGSRGMIGGQVIDIENEGAQISKPLLDTLHSLKTGALIRAAVGLGCLASGASGVLAKAADSYAARLGLIFQIVDDLLDITSTPEELGKPVGSDAANGKTTYAGLYGLEGSGKILQELVKEAKAICEQFGGDTVFLRELIDNMVTRTK